MNPGKISTELNQLTFSILLSGYKAFPTNWKSHAVNPQYHSFWVVTKGKADISFNGKSYKLQPGKIIFFTPGFVYDKKSSSTAPLEFYFVRFSYAMAFEEKNRWHFKEEKDIPFPLSSVFTIKNFPAAILLLEKITHATKSKGPTVSLKLKILFQEFLYTLIQDLQIQEMSGDSRQAIEATIDFMINHYKESISLHDLAHIAGLSPSHYSRLFKKYIGYTPIDYLTHVRIDRAKELLALSNLRVKEISESIGYEDELYFSRTFKKIVGISPSQFSDEQK